MNENPQHNLSEEGREPIIINETINEYCSPSPPEDKIDVGSIMKNYLRHWYWFILSFAVCGFLGWTYMHKKSPQYLIKSIIMLNQNDDESTNLSSLSALASQFGFGGGSSSSSSNIYDEMTRLRSEKLLSRVVSTLHLNETSWSEDGFFKPKSWYNENAPYSIQIPQTLLDTLSVATKFQITTLENGKTYIKVKQAKKDVLEAEIKGFPYTAKTPAAMFVIDTTKYYKRGKPLDFHSMILGTPLTVYDLQTILSIDEVDKKGNAIYQDITTPNIPRGEAILNTITSLYNKDRNQQRLTRREDALKFIEGRLMNLYAELEESENKIENYKRENKIVDAQAEAEYIFTRKGLLESATTQTRTEMEIYTMLRDMLESPDTQLSLLPFASSAGGEEATSLGKAVSSYNELILKRMELMSGVKGQSAQIDRIDDQLAALRDNILTSLSRDIEAKRIALAEVEGANQISDERITEIPSMEKHLTQLYRDREVKNAIYAFLLQKREEAEIAVQKVEPIIEVIDPAYADPEPVNPKPMLVYGLSGFFGLLLPLVFVKLLCKPKKKKKKKKSKKQRKETEPDLVVG